MARCAGPDFVALQVPDPEASSAFYQDVLGLERAPQSPPGAVVFTTTPVPFALRTPTVDLGDRDQRGRGVALWLRCDDTDALAAAIAEAGVDVVAATADSPFGRACTFIDPDGYRIILHDGG